MKLKAKAFISGSIQGMETRQSYRERVSEICVRCGYEPVDPCARGNVWITSRVASDTRITIAPSELKYKKKKI